MLKKVLTLIIFCLISISLYSDEDIRSKLLNLSQETKEFLDTKPVLRIANEIDWAPYDYMQEEEPSGIAIELVKTLSKILGFEIEWINGYTWSELLTMIEHKEIDILPCVMRNKERSEYINFSDPLLQMSFGIITLDKQQNNDIFFDLSNAQVAFIQSHGGVENALRKFGTTNAIEVPSTSVGIDAVKTGKVDAFIDDIYVLKNYAETSSYPFNLRPLFKTTQGLIAEDLMVGIRKDWPLLVEAINAAIIFIYEEEYKSIINRNINSKSMDTQHFITTKTEPFTKEEVEWLYKNREVPLFFLDNYPPFLYYEESTPVGIISGYLDEIERILGISFYYKGQSEPLENGIKMLLNNDVSVFPALAETEQRIQQGLLFGKQFSASPIAIYGNRKSGFSRSISSITEEYRVLTIKGHAINEWLTKDYPLLKITNIPSAEVGLKMVDRNKKDLFIGDISTTNRVLARNHFKHILLLGSTNYSYTIGMAFNEQNRILLNIINKILPSIKTEKGSFIESYWAGQKVDTKISPTTYLIGGVILLLIVLIFFFQAYIYRMKSRLLKKHALTDPLTGLSNRRLLDTIFEEERARAYRDSRHLSFIMFDIDYFKKFNDTYGHHAGDEALIKVAQSFQTIFKREVDHCFRLGGEEFGVLTTVEKSQDAYNLANKLITHVINLNIPHKKNYPLRVLTLSGGVVVVDNHSTKGFQNYFSAADVRLYQAKKAGRNRIL